MRKRRGKELEVEEPHINLMPLIDVVFVVLVMFVIVAPILELDRIELAQGTSGFKETTNVQENSPISILVDSHDALFFNKKAVSLQELKRLLIQAKGKHPREIPQLFHDKKAHFGTYQSVKNAIEEAGFEQLDIVLEPGNA
ncbi:MAG: hypothetical protein RLZZ453_569 [Chlamydiota bacterium]